MRGTVAKRIRKMVYGDFSPRQREYKSTFVNIFNKFKKEKTRKAIKLRAVYKFMKKQYTREGKLDGKTAPAVSRRR